MQLHDFLYDGQPQTCALRDIRVASSFADDVVDFFGRDTDTGITDRADYELWMVCSSNSDFAVCSVFQRIGDEVLEQLEQKVWIGWNLQVVWHIIVDDVAPGVGDRLAITLQALDDGPKGQYCERPSEAPARRRSAHEGDSPHPGFP